MTAPHRSVAARALLRAVGFYSRAVSPALPPRCRFHPTCSAYAAEAVAVHGAARGSWLAVVRLLKCAPWHPGGVDLVPPRPGGTAGAPRSSSSPVSAPRTPSDVPGPVPATPPVAGQAFEETSVA
ncbi:membrane protein insertion efficiency factor YidD [Blastococcus sp. TF02A-35]|uniref:membrane protein insertion efficiency factor YidD n=1 Tax=Blastococcus sp. TF02A-35 TaxID=2559612 RepID=UPI0010745DA3|nr:membrane protein insertion efficiency factor YidD [Blastococcus sp. TF02A_35]TFV45696.1 membrane protein insertion efficiency factor YidD [Blastococcus sp. TF02A_35]